MTALLAMLVLPMRQGVERVTPSMGRPKLKGHCPQRVMLAVVALLLAGCASSDMSDLEGKVEEILARPPGKIKPLPAIQPYRAYAYASGQLGKRDPYTVFYRRPLAGADDASQDDGLTDEWKKEMEARNQEDLEQFELDSLRMFGVLENAEHVWGIVGDPEGIVHHVEVGNYLGKNFGKIIEIGGSEIVLREIVKNSSGRWEERSAQLVIVD